MLELSDDTLSLYFDLREGRKADLETVARAAIEWSTSIRLAAKMVEPNSVVRIEFVSTEEGSIWLTTKLEWAEDKARMIATGGGRYPYLVSMALGLAIFIVFEPTRDYLLGEMDQIDLNPEERQQFDEIVEEVSNSEELKKTNMKFFAAIEAEPAIKSIGVSDGPRKPMAFSVKSDRFAERSGLWEQSDKPLQRTSERVSDVVLDNANLSEKQGKWRFTDIATGLKFSAEMKDEDFLKSLKEGGVNESLRIGIKMQIHITFKEKNIDGKWISDPSTIKIIRLTLEET